MGNVLIMGLLIMSGNSYWYKKSMKKGEITINCYYINSNGIVKKIAIKFLITGDTENFNSKAAI